MEQHSIDPGRFRHRLNLESESKIPDGCGGFESDWQSVAQLWAAIEPTQSHQSVIVDRLATQSTSRIIIRWRNDCTAQMRFTKPGHELLIKTVIDPDETQRYLICICEEIE